MTETQGWILIALVVVALWYLRYITGELIGVKDRLDRENWATEQTLTFIHNNVSAIQDDIAWTRSRMLDSRMFDHRSL